MSIHVKPVSQDTINFLEIVNPVHKIIMVVWLAMIHLFVLSVKACSILKLIILVNYVKVSLLDVQTVLMM